MQSFLNVAPAVQMKKMILKSLYVHVGEEHYCYYYY